MADGTAPLQFPVKLQGLFRPKRYKVVYGGRGKGASWNIARALLMLGMQSVERILCCREIQKSIDDSVYALLLDQINQYAPFKAFYGPGILKNEINGLNGTSIIFAGLRHNVDNIKSAEGITRVWVAEAHNVSKDSWNKLIPTIRKDGSEIWIDFNPELDTDETYKRFVISPPTESEVIFMTWRDNPWFPAVLRQEMIDLRNRSEDEYLHVYEGHTKQTLEGAIYAKELREAQSAGQITRVPWIKDQPVHVFFDLGYGNNTSLWFMQKIGLTYRFLHTYQDRLKLFGHYLDYIKKTEYVIGTLYLPHDGDADNIRGKSPAETARAAGFRVKVVPRVQSKIIGIDSVRAMFPACWFDEEGCADGLQALRRYVWDKAPNGVYMREPKHTEDSDYADAFQQFGLGFSEAAAPAERSKVIAGKLSRVVNLDLGHQAGNWMSR